ncbi:hypothetical protein MKW98_006839 [Papaver atlanticum]|uniref:Uncharacterized protein n=1 Tax=Papaver atlanticum TaxID=357466 RepID=A0AAD4XKY9_9MAGN|nr:hypothetical protein MKW98_006839 [Papaver atlanticum]
METLFHEIFESLSSLLRHCSFCSQSVKFSGRSPVNTNSSLVKRQGTEGFLEARTRSSYRRKEQWRQL